MKIVSITHVWNSALWIEAQLRQLYPLVDELIIEEINYTSPDPRWAGDTSPDGTAEIIRNFPDPEGKIHFRQRGGYPYGVLAARAELCAQIPECDWVLVADCDEFQRNVYLDWLTANLPRLDPSITAIKQTVYSFYFDFTHHTVEEFTRLHRWYPGFNCWTGGPPWPVKEARIDKPPLFHYSYVPVPGVAIKGCRTFDVRPERYDDWYRNVLCAFDGSNLDEVQSRNQDGIHVFGGCPLHEYHGPHPEVLDSHPLRHLRWEKGGYIDNRTDQPANVKGWWNR